MTEIWKTIPDHPDYEVSTLGYVRSWKRAVPLILSPGRTPEGYLQVSLFDCGVQRMCIVGRLVLLTFVGKPPFDDMQAAHGNGVRDDNRLANLRWGTPTEAATNREVRGNTPRGERVGSAKLTSADVVELRRAYAAGGVSQANLSARYNIGAANTSAIITGKIWAHAGGPIDSGFHGCSNAKLTQSDAEEIRAAYSAGGISQAQLGARYGVSGTAVGHVIRGKSWTSVK